MKRLGVMAICLSVMFGSAVLGAVVYGRTFDANPLTAYGFALCGDVPCFRGVIPGITTAVDVKRVLPDLGLGNGAARLEPWSNGGIRFTTAIGPGSLVPGFDGQASREVRIEQDPNHPVSDPLRLGDFFVLYGKPCNVEALVSSNTRRPLQITVVWPRLKVLALRPSSPRRLELLGARSQTTLVVIGNPLSNYCAETLEQNTFRLPWLGFSRYARYYP